jgi:hypothetical protein
MSVTMHITITTKEGCFDDFYALAKEELAFTRGSKGCLVLSGHKPLRLVDIRTSNCDYSSPPSSRDTLPVCLPQLSYYRS